MWSERKIGRFIAEHPDHTMVLTVRANGTGGIVADASITTDTGVVVASVTGLPAIDLVPAKLAESFRAGLADAAKADPAGLPSSQREALSQGIPALVAARPKPSWAGRSIQEALHETARQHKAGDGAKRAGSPVP